MNISQLHFLDIENWLNIYFLTLELLSKISVPWNIAERNPSSICFGALYYFVYPINFNELKFEIGDNSSKKKFRQEIV